MEHDQEDHLLQIVRQLADAIIVLQRRVSMLEQRMPQRDINTSDQFTGQFFTGQFSVKE